MPIQDLNPSSIISATGWTGASVANLSASDDVRATDGRPGEVISAELDDAPGEFDSLNTVRLRFEARAVGTVSRDKGVIFELLDGSDNVLQTFNLGNIINLDSDTPYTSVAFPRSDALAVVNAYRARLTVTEGPGMADSATVEIDRIWVEIDYNEAAEAVSGSGVLSADDTTASGAGTSGSTGTGGPQAGASAVSGSGASLSTGTGEPASSAATADGAGTSSSTGTGALSAGAATVEGADTTSITGTGALLASAASVAGAGISSSGGSGALLAATATATGTGISASGGTGAIVSPVCTASGAGISASSGPGALAAASATARGSDAAASGAAQCSLTLIGLRIGLGL